MKRDAAKTARISVSKSVSLIEVFGPRLPLGSRGAADDPAYTDDRARQYVAQIMVNG
jgi:hypothetical protein